MVSLAKTTTVHFCIQTLSLLTMGAWEQDRMGTGAFVAPVMAAMVPCCKDLLTYTCSFALAPDRPLAAGAAECTMLESTAPLRMRGGGESWIAAEGREESQVGAEGWDEFRVEAEGWMLRAE